MSHSKVTLLPQCVVTTNEKFTKKYLFIMAIAFLRTIINIFFNTNETSTPSKRRHVTGWRSFVIGCLDNHFILKTNRETASQQTLPGKRQSNIISCLQLKEINLIFNQYYLWKIIELRTYTVVYLNITIYLYSILPLLSTSRYSIKESSCFYCGRIKNIIFV